MTNRKSKILIVEDNGDIRESVAAILSFEGFAVFTAPSVEEAEKIFELTNVDLIVSDIMLPGKSGLEFLKDVQSSESLRRIPVILLTAKSSLEEIRTGMLTGADDYIPKPFKTADLIESIKLRLKKRANVGDIRENSEFGSRLQSKFGIELKDIKYIAASNQYSTIYTGKKNVTLSKSLKFWEENLDEREFIRINRNRIINVNKIECYSRKSETAVKIKLEEEEEFISVSRRRMRKILPFLKSLPLYEE